MLKYILKITGYTNFYQKIDNKLIIPLKHNSES